MSPNQSEIEPGAVHSGTGSIECSAPQLFSQPAALRSEELVRLPFPGIFPVRGIVLELGLVCGGSEGHRVPVQNTWFGLYVPTPGSWQRCHEGEKHHGPTAAAAHAHNLVRKTP